MTTEGGLRLALYFAVSWLLTAASAPASPCPQGNRCSWTRPEIAAIALEQLQDPSTVPAGHWRSLYCLEWRDQCTKCIRKSLTSKIDCQAVSGVGRVCEGNSTLCTKPDEKLFDKFCAGRDFLSVEVHLVQDQGREQGVRRTTRSGGNFWQHWDKVKSHWENWEEESYIINKIPPRTDDIVDRYFGQQCVGVYSKEDVLKLR